MIKLVIILSVAAATHSLGRKPTKSDHTLCQKVYGKEYNDALNDHQMSALLLKIEAYNSGKSGSPCKTTCRFVGKIQKKLEPINSPDNIKCGPDMYCNSGKCVPDAAPAASQDALTVCEEDLTDDQNNKDDTTNTKVETTNPNPELLNDQTVKEERTDDDSSTKQESTTKEETTKEETTGNESKKEESKEVSANDDSAKQSDRVEGTKDESSSDKQSTKDESREKESTKEETKEESSS